MALIISYKKSNILQEKPYGIPLEKMKALTLEQLKNHKDFADGTEFIRDFHESKDYLTHEDVNKYTFDMVTEGKEDYRSSIVQAAQSKFEIPPRLCYTLLFQNWDIQKLLHQEMMTMMILQVRAP